LIKSLFKSLKDLHGWNCEMDNAYSCCQTKHFTFKALKTLFYKANKVCVTHYQTSPPPLGPSRPPTVSRTF